MPVTKNLRDATVRIKDDGANVITLEGEEGDLTFTEHDEAFVVLDRGSLSHARMGDEQPVEGSFTLKFREFYAQDGAADPTPYEALTRSGDADDWASTNDDGGGVYTVELEVEIDDPDEENQDEKITFAKLHAQSVEFSEGDEYNTLSFDFIDFEVVPTYAKV